MTCNARTHSSPSALVTKHYISGHNYISSFELANFGVKMKKIFGIKNQKKGDDSDEEYPSYTDPTALHATDPPVRNTKGISQPHYPPPRPCHGSPNPQRKNEGCTVPVQTNKNPQLTANNRNSYPALVTGEPKRAPPRVNITKKVNKPSTFRTKYCTIIVKCLLAYVRETIPRKLSFSIKITSRYTKSPSALYGSISVKCINDDLYPTDIYSTLFLHYCAK